MFAAPLFYGQWVKGIGVLILAPNQMVYILFKYRNPDLNKYYLRLHGTKPTNSAANSTQI